MLEPVAQLWLSPVPEERLGPLLGALRGCSSSAPKRASPGSFTSEDQTLAEQSQTLLQLLARPRAMAQGCSKGSTSIPAAPETSQAANHGGLTHLVTASPEKARCSALAEHAVGIGCKPGVVCLIPFPPCHTFLISPTSYATHHAALQSSPQYFSSRTRPELSEQVS